MKKLFTLLLISAISQLINAQIPSYIPKDSLVGWWPFNGNANDESGNSNNGTLYGATLTKDRFNISNSAFYFDGTNDYIEVPSSTALSVSKSYTISAWVNIDAFNSGGFPYQPAIVSKISGGDWYGGYELRGMSNSTGIPKFFGTSGNIGGKNVAPSTSNYNINNWYNITATYNGAIVRLYINGNCADSISANGNLQTSSIPLRFGRRGGGPNYDCWLSGTIDDIGIWNRALNSNEVKALYSGCGIFSISQDPSNQTSKINDNVYFSTLASDTTASYQWQSNASNLGWTNIPANTWYSGVQSKKLTIKNIQLNNHKQLFRVIAFKNSCKDTSNTATLTVLDTCINIINDTIAVQDTLIINAKLTGTTPLQTNLIKVYPNPAKDHLVIDFGNYSSMAGYEINIFDVAGKSVYNSTINKAIETIDLNTWTGKGIYFIKIFDKLNQQIENRKIVIQ